MKTIRMEGDGLELEFGSCKKLADAVAAELLGETICLTWYDKGRDQESPAHISECHDDACETPGYIEYAESRGARLHVVCGKGDFEFCYRPIGEFAEVEGQNPGRESRSSSADDDQFDWPRGG